MRKVAMVVASAAVVLAMAGCGASGSDSSAPTKAEFIEQSNAICKKGNEELQKKQAAAGELADVATATTFIRDTMLPGIRSQVDAIKALGFPAADQAELNKLWDAIYAAIDKIDEDPEALLQGSDPFGPINEQLVAYGLTECGASE